MKNNIDNMLQEWSRQKAASEEHLDKLSVQIAEKATKAGPQERVPVSVSLWGKLAYAGAGAVGMLLAVLIYCGLFVDTSQEGQSRMSPAAYASISSDEIEQGRNLLHEMERLFPKQLRWIAESNGDMALGVESIVNGDEDAIPMLMRLTVVSRDLDEKRWVPSWRADVLMRGEEMVEIRPAKENENSLAFWVYPLVDGKLAVDGQLSLEAPVRLASQINRVIRPGETIEVASVKNDAKEYRVYQTVEVL